MASAMTTANTASGMDSRYQVAFVTPFAPSDAERWWRGLASEVAAGPVLAALSRDRGCAVGAIPRHAAMPDGTLAATAVFSKELAP